MHISLPSILILGVMWAVSICPNNADGLKCYTCNPCDKSHPGTSKECNLKPYKHLLDKGKLACSYEHGIGGAIRKRCAFIRDDPDDGNVANDEISCSQSPRDLNRLDCVCFTDNCNLEWPHRDRAAQPGEETDSDSGGSQFQRGNSIPKIFIVGLLGLMFCLPRINY